MTALIIFDAWVRFMVSLLDFLLLYIGAIALKLLLIFGYVHFTARKNKKLLKRYSITPLVCFSLQNYQLCQGHGQCQNRAKASATTH